MFDETNNTEEQGFELPEKLFESSEPETLAEDHGGEEKANDTITIKYNGEERDITLDEARVLAQKGMNYDHVLSERDTKYQRELAFLDRVAEENGMTRAQYIAAHEKKSQGNEESATERPISSADRAREQIRQISERVGTTGKWENLFKKYPDLSRREAILELEGDVRRGATPLEAYQSKLLTERERELAIARNNSATQAKSIGSLIGDGSIKERDAFLEGFFSED